MGTRHKKICSARAGKPFLKLCTRPIGKIIIFYWLARLTALHHSMQPDHQRIFLCVTLFGGRIVGVVDRIPTRFRPAAAFKLAAQRLNSGGKRKRLLPRRRRTGIAAAISRQAISKIAVILLVFTFCIPLSVIKIILYRQAKLVNRYNIG